MSNPRFKAMFLTGEREGQTVTILGAKHGVAVLELDSGEIITHPAKELRLEFTEHQKEQFSAALGIIQQAWDRMRDQMKPIAAALQSALRSTQDDYTLAPQDPRRRALWLRDHRNTGPAKDQYEHRGQR